MIFNTDWGWMGVVVCDAAVARVALPLGERSQAEARLAGCTQISCEASDQNRELLERIATKLTRYIAGENVRFAERLDFTGLSVFRHDVYVAARQIPYGEVRSYGRLANECGNRSAARAVGQCMATNPFPIIVPCHRVVGSAGHLIGFGSGIEMKRRLLRLEGVETRGDTVAVGPR